MTNAIIFDSETTGLVDPQIIESAFIRLDGVDELNKLESGYSRYRPSKPIELGAMATHNIMDEDLQNETLDHSDFILPGGVEFLIGHNIDFDWAVIGKPNIYRIDTLALSRYLWPDLDAHRQTAMIYHLYRDKARDLVKNAHCALDDVKNCYLLLLAIFKRIEDTKKTAIFSWMELWELSEKARIPTKMAFGKHKGMLIKDLPSDYVRWLERQPDMDPYLLKALR